LALPNPGNHSAHEHVTVTESTVSGTGLFGNNAVRLHHGNTATVVIGTGQPADTYTVVGSHPGARFGSQIEIDGHSTVGMNVPVALDARSGLNLSLLNEGGATPAPASLFISAPGGRFSKPTPTLPAGIEDATFTGGLVSEVVYNGFTSVTHS
jgi:hypothetical protein